MTKDAANGLVIVAIPSEDDYVWKISSEKIPHLTMLFLGEQTNASKVENIAEFVQHVAKTSIPRFGLSVDRRGTLGPKNADVLFFDKTFGIKNLEEARSYLLKDETISEMWNSTEQYPEWTPHLTLGFPETPAHPYPETRDYSISWVNFDRIALWTGDSVGPTFQLKSNESNAIGVDSMSMSDIISDILSNTNKSNPDSFAEKYFKHYGRKGMHWGVRHPVDSSTGLVKSTSTASTGKTKIESVDHERFVKSINKAKQNGVKSLSNDELNSVANRIRKENDFSKLTSERAQAQKSKGRKIIEWTADSLFQGAKQEAQNQLRKQGGDLIKQVFDKTVPPEARNTANSPTSTKTNKNPNGVKISSDPITPTRIIVPGKDLDRTS